MGDREKGQSTKKEMEEEEIRRLLLGIMEGYNDAVIPPLSFFSPSHGIPITESSGKRQRNEASWEEGFLRERKRKEQMSENFSLLQSMVPALFDVNKPPKEKIISDTVDYIKYLKEEIKRLEALKKFQWEESSVGRPVLSKCTNQNPSVKAKVYNEAKFLAIQLPFRRGSVVDIVKVLEKHQAEVLEARICVDDQRLLTFTATVMLGSGGGSTIDKIRGDILTLLV